MTVPRWMGVAGALLCGLAVAAGAFGAHVLEGVITPQRLVTFDTAARYQMFQGLGLVALQALSATGLLQPRTAGRLGTLFLAGAVVFCGALFLLVAGGPGVLGAVAPVGGILMVAGWGFLALSLWRRG